MKNEKSKFDLDKALEKPTSQETLLKLFAKLDSKIHTLQITNELFEKRLERMERRHK